MRQAPGRRRNPARIGPTGRVFHGQRVDYPGRADATMMAGAAGRSELSIEPSKARGMTLHKRFNTSYNMYYVNPIAPKSVENFSSSTVDFQLTRCCYDGCLAASTLQPASVANSRHALVGLAARRGSSRHDAPPLRRDRFAELCTGAIPATSRPARARPSGLDRSAIRGHSAPGRGRLRPLRALPGIRSGPRRRGSATSGNHRASGSP